MIKEENFVRAIILKPGEIICDRCNGSGYESTYEPPTWFSPQTNAWRCKKCYGSKKVTWLENVLGKEEDVDSYVNNLHNKYYTSSTGPR